MHSVARSYMRHGYVVVSLGLECHAAASKKAFFTLYLLSEIFPSHSRREPQIHTPTSRWQSKKCFTLENFGFAFITLLHLYLRELLSLFPSWLSTCFVVVAVSLYYLPDLTRALIIIFFSLSLVKLLFFYFASAWSPFHLAGTLLCLVVLFRWWLWCRRLFDSLVWENFLIFLNIFCMMHFK